MASSDSRARRTLLAAQRDAFEQATRFEAAYGRLSDRAHQGPELPALAPVRRRYVRTLLLLAVAHDGVAEGPFGAEDRRLAMEGAQDARRRAAQFGELALRVAAELDRELARATRTEMTG